MRNDHIDVEEHIVSGWDDGLGDFLRLFEDQEPNALVARLLDQSRRVSFVETSDTVF